MFWMRVVEGGIYARDSAHAPQLHLFVGDLAAPREALAYYEAIHPVLKGERSLPQQSQQAGQVPSPPWPPAWSPLRADNRYPALGTRART